MSQEKARPDHKVLLPKGASGVFLSVEAGPPTPEEDSSTFSPSPESKLGSLVP